MKTDRRSILRAGIGAALGAAGARLVWLLPESQALAAQPPSASQATWVSEVLSAADVSRLEALATRDAGALALDRFLASRRAAAEGIRGC